MTTKRIYLIRHGETDYNVKGIVQGRRIDSDLNETGIFQRDMLSKVFAHEPIDHIYLSSLKRTFQTMKPLVDKGIAYSRVADLDELDFGEIEGFPIFDSNGESVLKEIIEKWRSGQFMVKFPGGESPLEALLRVKDGFEKILEAEDEKTIIICLHQRILRIVLCFLLQKPLTEMDSYPHHNTGVTTIDYNYTTGLFSLVALNEVTHLNLEKQL